MNQKNHFDVFGVSLFYLLLAELMYQIVIRSLEERQK